LATPLAHHIKTAQLVVRGAVLVAVDCVALEARESYLVQLLSFKNGEDVCGKWCSIAMTAFVHTLSD